MMLSAVGKGIRIRSQVQVQTADPSPKMSVFPQSLAPSGEHCEEVHYRPSASAADPDLQRYETIATYV